MKAIISSRNRWGWEIHLSHPGRKLAGVVHCGGDYGNPKGCHCNTHQEQQGP